MASWQSIPVEILALIFTYLQCFADLASIAGVCRDWRAAARLRVSQEPRYHQLPWLLQPSLDAAPSSSMMSVLSGTRRRISLPEDARCPDRFCGSHDGGWIAIAANLEGPCVFFVNLILPSSQRIPLPRELRPSPFTGPHRPEIRMVTLSDKPTAKDCVAAAHIIDCYPSIIFCRPHVDDHWVAPLMDTEALQDTLYHRGDVYEGFYAISKMDNLYVFLPRVINGDGGTALVVRKVIISFQPAPSTARKMVASSMTRYLVESRGRLLLVVRYSGMAAMSTGGQSSSSTGVSEQRTLHFKVFEMELNPLLNGGHSASWVELNGLDGRVIFIGKGCSRAFEASQYKGFQGGSIYFLDDAVGSGILYSMFVFADIGMYSMGEKKIVRPGLPIPGSRVDDASSLRSAKRVRAELLLFSGLGASLPGLHAGDDRPSNSLYGPRDLMVRSLSNMSHSTELVTRSVQVVSEVDHVAIEANTKTSDSGEQVIMRKSVASVWPLLCKPGASRRPIWFLPPPTHEWFLPPPPANE